MTVVLGEVSTGAWGDRCYCPVFVVCLACNRISHTVVQADAFDLSVVTTVVLGIQPFATRDNCGLILKIR